MSKYHSAIAGNDKVEMVHISSDDNAQAASKWAAAEKFPWLTILPEEARSSELHQFGSGFVPDYVLVSAEGEKIATGKDKVFEEAKKL